MKYTMKKLMSMLLVICMMIGLLPTTVSAASVSNTYTILEDVVLHELIGASTNGKQSCEFLWIDEKTSTLYVAFSVDSKKTFSEGEVTFDGNTRALVFEEAGSVSIGVCCWVPMRCSERMATQTLITGRSPAVSFLLRPTAAVSP